MAAAIPSPPSQRRLALVPRLTQSAPQASLVFASYLFRLPPLLNARSTNSDAAVVGLQAMHLLRGEHSPWIWSVAGTGYQTSADSYVAALFFALFGATPLVLMLSSLTLHVIATALVFDTLARRFRPWLAFFLTLPLVLAPSSVHSYALYPPRQLSLTLALAALCAIDRATLRWLVAGGLLYGLAIDADPYPLLLAPIVLGYALCVSPKSLGLTAAGAAVGIVPFVLLHLAPRASSGQLGLSLAVLGHNWGLLLKDCLPWALSYKVYYARHVMDYGPWAAPLPVRVVQIIGALGVAAIMILGLALFRRTSIPWPTRRLGLAGAATYPIAIGGFLMSVMVMDQFSMRYLVVLTLLLPFASATAAAALGTRRIVWLLAPHLVAASIGGWVGYGPFVHGIIPVRAPELADDYLLFAELQARGIRYAEADYWASYRLTFLFGERLIVVPTNQAEDRYRPYRAAFEASPRFAYVFDRNRSREDIVTAERDLRAQNRSVDSVELGALRVLVVQRN